MPKNILMISVDDMNAISALKKFFDGDIVTPNIDSLMSMGTTFDNAFCQTALCNPSRASVLSGKSPVSLAIYQGEGLLPAFEKTETLHGVIKAQGYHTASTGKIYHQQYKYPEMFDETYYSTGSNPQADRFFTAPFPGNVEDLADYQNTSWAVDFLENAAGSLTAPFFLSLGLSAPHKDWVVPQEYFDRFPLEKIILPEIIENDIADLPEYMQLFLDSKFQQSVLDADAWPKMIQGYLAEVSFADEMIGRVLGALTNSGLQADTSIVLWSDHGQHFGEKEKWNKVTLWEEAGKSPLIIVDPDIGTPGQHVDDVVELLDIFPTILDLAGVAPVSWTEGRSLVPLLDGTATSWDGVAFTNVYGSFSVRTGEHRYIRHEDGSEELYDIRQDQDPNQWTNLADNSSYATIKAELSARLNQYLQEHSVFLSNEETSTLVGTDENDTFVGGHETTLAGGLGDDTYFIHDQGASVVENIGEGHDRVITYVDFKLPETVEDLWAKAYTKGTGNKFSGNKLDNTIVGSFGNDVVMGMEGNDFIRTTSGNDTIWGNSGNDTLNGETGNDILHGGDGDDILRGRSGNDTFVFSGANGNDRIYDFQDGGNLIDFSAYAVNAIGDFDIDQVGVNTVLSNYGGGTIRLDNITAGDLTDGDFIFGSGPAPIVGTGSADSLVGTPGIDHMSGFGGDDTLRGEGGDDTLLGGDGDDFLVGKEGSDTLEGGDGDDHLRGNDDEDRLDGGRGNDYLFGGDAVDRFVFSGLNGDDRIADFQDGTDRIHFTDYAVDDVADFEISQFGSHAVISNYGGGTVKLLNFDSTNLDDGDFIFASGPAPIVGTADADSLPGTPDNDHMSGLGGDDTLQGGDGDDTLGGGDGADSMDGGPGNDRLDGGAGDDTVSGGEGHDSIVAGSGAGDDEYHGDGGIDTVTYASTTAGVDVDLTAGAATGSEIDSDTLDGIENVIGGAGDDSLVGDAADNVIDGRAGNDTLRGQAGDDTFSGGGGDDLVVGGTGADWIGGDDGDDTLRGNDGDDTLLGGDGNDVLVGNDGADSIRGDAGDDIVFGDAGDNTIDGAAGNDRLEGEDGADVIDGGDGDDTVEAGGGADTLDGGEGNDILNARAGDDMVAGGVGNDTVRGHGGDDTLAGGVGDDQVVGEDGNDTMIGEAGDDTMWGGNDTDTLSGGIGDDRVNGGAGDDVVSGDAGDDSVFGLDGDDTLDGGAGNDVIGGGSGNDILDAGDGNDLLFGIDGDDTLDGGGGSDSLYGGDNDDWMDGGEDDDVLIGGAGGDTLLGGGGDDIVNGENANDSLAGGAGNDTVRGGDGADTLDGGAGNDFLNGNAGADVLVFVGANGNDTLGGFDDGLDLIDFTAYGVDDVGDFTIAQAGAHTVISGYDVSGGTIRLNNTDAGDIDDGDFLFLI